MTVPSESGYTCRARLACCRAAHELKPVFQPSRASNSRMRSRRRAIAASRCADSSAISSPSWSRERVSITSPPCSGATLHRSFGPACEPPGGAITEHPAFFVRNLLIAAWWAAVRLWAGIRRAALTRPDCARRRLSSGKCGRHAAGPDDHRVEVALDLRLEVGVDLVDLGQLGEGPAAERAEVVD